MGRIKKPYFSAEKKGRMISHILFLFWEGQSDHWIQVNNLA